MGDQGPRVAPGTRAELGRVNAGIARLLGYAAGGGPPNIFTTLGRHRGLFRRWLWFAGGLMPGGTLPRADSELVILRVAHVTGCAYEWDHHERLGAKAGLAPEQIARVRDGAQAPGWSPRQALLLRAVDELHAEGRIGDALWAELAREYDEPRLIELCLLIGHYVMLAMTLITLGVELDERPGGAARGVQGVELDERPGGAARGVQAGVELDARPADAATAVHIAPATPLARFVRAAVKRRGA